MKSNVGPVKGRGAADNKRKEEKKGNGKKRTEEQSNCIKNALICN